MISRDLAYLEDIRLNAEFALSFVAEKTFEEFSNQVLLKYGVIHCLMIVGEAANRVSKDARQTLPQIDWSGMIGLRHVVVHQYGRVDLDEIWTIVHRDLPPLVAELTTFLAQHP